MCRRVCLIFAVLVAGATSDTDIEIVTRDQWGARPPRMVEPMANPVPYVVIHHSYIPAACNTSEECVQAMKWMQDFHQLNRSWNDVGYSFAVGGDGKAYVGRGWSAVGAHAPKFNNKSIGICIIGDWRHELPPVEQLQAVQQLIDLGVRENKISPDYILLGHKQARLGTECPGDRLYKEIQTWKNWQPSPTPKVEPKEEIDDGNILKKRTADNAQ
ncbi:peptidoglycan-recognition protein LB [Aethina tumida]|uniref:peptidoglycan-recognition protein LB n=1 Tax=Aethina tumida TaxID=116153 RepID=UPI00096B236D|nr:peptidoglycan-recognition protein LB [Aethina tumida]